MEIIIKDKGGYTFSKTFSEDKPTLDEALFAASYLISRLYPTEDIKNALHEFADNY